MIEEKILREIAIKDQTSFVNVAREYLQLRFLDCFYRQKGSERVLFKGGTALRLIFRSPRFSEDLDFSASFSKCVPIENLLQETLLSLQKEAINLGIEESKTTSGGCLAIFSSNIYNATVGIKADISLRYKQSWEGEKVLIQSPLSPPFLATTATSENLVKGKLEALLERQKPRDFYDLYFILRANLLPADQGKVLRKVKTLLERSNINFEQELKQFLPKSHWPLIKDFRATLNREIKRFV